MNTKKCDDVIRRRVADQPKVSDYRPLPESSDIHEGFALLYFCSFDNTQNIDTNNTNTFALVIATLYNYAMTDFATRQKEYNLLCFDETRAAIRNPDTIVIDLRKPEEINDEGKIERSNFHNIVVSLDDASALEACAPTTLPDKNASILVYCKSGRRATNAVKTLHKLGYTKVMNGGGYTDVKAALAEGEPTSQ